MDVYASEEEQVEAIKKWWKENGTSVVLGVLIGAGALFGWRYWESQITSKGEAASVVYTEFGNLISENKTKEAEQVGKSLIETHKDTPYASLASLALARKAVEAKDSATAISHLQWVIDNSDLAEIKQAASLRLARIHLSEGNADAAWKLVGPLAENSKLASVNELKGDILLAQKKTEEARNAYLQAVALTPQTQSGPGGADSQGSSFLEMKLHDLGVKGE